MTAKAVIASFTFTGTGEAASQLNLEALQLAHRLLQLLGRHLTVRVGTR
jgi:hypothetical protein